MVAHNCKSDLPLVEGLTESNWYIADILSDPNRKVETEDSIWENGRTKKGSHNLEKPTW